MSEITPYESIDFLEEARGRLTEQFRSKDVIDRYLQLLINQQQELEQVFKDLIQLRSIDTAFGEQLDVIGRIVGQPRELLDTSLLSYFAFDGYPDAQPYGDLNDASVGGFYYSFGDPLTGNTLLNDEQYRMFIKAKIIKNTTRATPEEFLNFISFVFGVNINNVVSEGNAEFTILVGKELNSFERLLLTYSSMQNGVPIPFVPKPVGVKINYGQFNSDNYFGFQGAPNAKGYGDLGDPLAGGKYATLF